MRNHYFISYYGNKRNEIEAILPYINLDNMPTLTTIIEPFAGSAAMSYYISTQYPKKFKYVLNDNDIQNYRMFLISRDPILTEQFNIDINRLIDEFNTYTDDASRKDFYKSIDTTTLVGNIFTTRFSAWGKGMYPLIKKRKQIKSFKLQDFPIYDFYNNEDITYEITDGVDIINKYNTGDSNLFLIDPPYLKTSHNFYSNLNMDIYAWVKDNKELLFQSKNKILFILEPIDKVKNIFSDFKILVEYNKRYYIRKEHISTHIVYSNL